jgi:hypothetical protein
VDAVAASQRPTESSLSSLAREAAEAPATGQRVRDLFARFARTRFGVIAAVLTRRLPVMQLQPVQAGGQPKWRKSNSLP